MNDPDAMWKPGYDGPPPIVESPDERADEQPRRETDRTEPARHRRRGRWFGAGVGVALGLVLAAAVLLDPSDSTPTSERPDPSVFGGPAARRLPGSAAPLWSVDVGSNGDHWVDVIGRDLVIVAVAESVGTPVGARAPATPATTLVALDARTGEQRWTLRLTADPRNVAVIGAVDDVLVLEEQNAIGPSVIGVDVMSGETRWATAAEPSEGHLGLVGTPFIARLPSSSDRFVSLIDALSGRDVGTIVSESTAPGRPAGWSTDRRGTWYVIDDGEVVEYDLSTDPGTGTIIGSVDDATAPYLVVDDLLAIVDDAGSMTLEGVGASSPVTGLAEVPGPVGSLTPVSGSDFVVTSPGSIAGVSVEGDAVNVTWSQRGGAMVADHPVEGGTILQVATRGGAGTELVDGRTGETIQHLTMMPGALQTLVVAGDGFVALRTSDLGVKVVGFSLDGTERWSIVGSSPLVVGDRVVVRATPTDVLDANSAQPSQRLRVTAHGDVE